MQRRIGRRRFLTGAAAVATLGALNGCRLTSAGSRSNLAQRLQLTPLRASIDRITRVTVCTRPFRAAGPRDEFRATDDPVVRDFLEGRADAGVAA